MSRQQPLLLAKTLYEMTRGQSEEQVQGTIRAFAAYLRKRRLSKHINKIIEQYRAYYNQRESSADAVIVTAQALSDQQLDSLRPLIAQAFGLQSVSLSQQLDPQVLGGYKLRLGEQVIDGSVQGKIKQLRSYLISNI